LTNTEVIIVGQGIAGSALALELEKKGIDFIILDPNHYGSSSMAAAGTINPITGRNYVKSWIFEDLKPVFKHTYSQLNEAPGEEFYKDLPIYRSLHSIKEENMWLSRKEDTQYDEYLDFHTSSDAFKGIINLPQSFGEIKGSHQVQLRALLPYLQKKWASQQKLINQDFDYNLLQIQENGVTYKDLQAEKIVFCEGHRVVHNPFFNHLPFDPVKGEALIIHLKEGFNVSLRDKIFITPIGHDLYWCGANYAWQYADHLPSKEGFDFVKSTLDQILLQPYEIVDHWAGIRPATKSRRPIIAQHEVHNPLFIFNGLGTKGSSLAPYFAERMVGEVM
jgi:glycine oxidase